MEKWYSYEFSNPKELSNYLNQLSAEGIRSEDIKIVIASNDYSRDFFVWYYHVKGIVYKKP